ncbi:MAG: 4Fe-4S dicluster domain-containing protein [Actinobacteria bacterium]|nr:4Fe-4S dicluster domain-containing protein [Actinomycetota bacterium]
MITGLNAGLEKRLEADTGQKVRSCYQCKKCSAGCPVAFAMDLLPHEVMRMVVYGQEARLLGSSTIWLCASCETCSTRCPNEIDIAGVMDGLRRMAVDEGVIPAEPEIAAFHKSFLAGIKLAGKTNEPVLIGAYKALSRRVFDDLGLGAVMLAKRKIKLLPRTVKDRRAVRRIFRGSKGGARM